MCRLRASLASLVDAVGIWPETGPSMVARKVRATNTPARTAPKATPSSRSKATKKTPTPRRSETKHAKGVAARQVSVTNADLDGPNRWATLIKVSAESGVALEDIEYIEDVDELRSVVRDKIEEAVGSHGLGAWFLSMDPLRDHRRELPVAGVDRIEPTERWLQKELERAAIEALRLAYTLGRDPLARRAPLHLELQAALEFTELMESFKRRWTEAAKRAAIPMVFHELSRLYEWVSSYWERRKPRASTALAVPRTPQQIAVLAEAEDKIRTVLAAHGRHLDYVEAADSLIPRIVFDGPEIRALGGARDAASSALTQLTGLKERAIQNTLNDITPLEVSRFEHAGHHWTSEEQLMHYLRELLFGSEASLFQLPGWYQRTPTRTRSGS